MAISVLKEVNRLPGYLPANDTEKSAIIDGMLLEFSPDGTGKVRRYQARGGTATGRYPIGWACEPTIQLPGGSVPAGRGGDYTGYARGGYVGMFVDGGMFKLYDDGCGAPWVEGNLNNYVIGKPVYAAQSTDADLSNAGKITATAPSDGDIVQVGIVVEKGTNYLVIKSLI